MSLQKSNERNDPNRRLQIYDYKTYSGILQWPLGSHRNYITHIALPNCLEYFSCKKHNEEEGRSGIPIKYAELRLFLNAVESLNNIPDYLYSEHTNRLKKYKDEVKFRAALSGKFPVLDKLSNLANAYKHCVRRKDDKSPKRASDMHHGHITVNISLSNLSLSRAGYEFSGPLPEHIAILQAASDFWLGYHNDNPLLDELINV